MLGEVALIKCTKASAEGVVTQLEKTTNTTREVEVHKLEVQLCLFTEHMEYQRERDRRLYEQSVLAVEIQ